MEPQTVAEPKWYDRPFVKEAFRIAIAVGLAWLASKGIKLPGELPVHQPVVVVVGPGATTPQ